MNPIRETWLMAGDLIWKRRIFGGWKKRALSYEARYEEMVRIHSNAVPSAFKHGWQSGWEEAIRIAGIEFNGFARPEENGEH